jgi:AcrR family transcriptional regulator
MTRADDDVRPRPGRRRDPACDQAILKATLDAFVEDGYGGVSIEGVAARAGVGKATIYRRYTSKADLVVDAVRVSAHIDDHLPDTGDLRADLIGMMASMVERLRGPDGKLLVMFAAERVSNPDLADAFERSVVGRKREHVIRLLQGAVVSESGPALIWHHALNGLPLTDDLPGRILAVVLPPVGA